MEIDRVTAIIEKDELEPVYCSKCKWHESDPQIRVDGCFHPNICNIKKWGMQSPIKEGHWYKEQQSGDCYEINANNDCEFFKKERFLLSRWV